MAEPDVAPAGSRSDSRTSKRPVGIWLLTAVYVVPTALNVWDKVELLRARGLPWMVGESHRASLYSPGGIEMSLVFSILLLVAAIAVFFRARIARYLLLAVLAVFVVELVNEVYWLSLLEQDDPAALTSSAHWWWVLSWPLGALLWFLLNAWYLFGTPTREFFNSARAQLRSGHA